MTPRERRRLWAHLLLGVALVAGATLLVLQATGALAPLREALLAVTVVLVGLLLLLAPLFWALWRRVTAERAARGRAQERAELAAHLHDSVLQTLALVRKRADDPQAVALLARRQERELRDWLQGRPPREPGVRLSDAIEMVAAEIEEDHGVAIELVRVGDTALNGDSRALIAAAREALANAARHGGGGPVSLYVECDAGGITLYVRDRGPGFDLAAVPADRRGIRDSISARMARHGGTARVTSGAEGTEVELILPAGGR